MKETLADRQSFSPSLLRLSPHEILEPRVLAPLYFAVANYLFVRRGAHAHPRPERQLRH